MEPLNWALIKLTTLGQIITHRKGTISNPRSIVRVCVWRPDTNSRSFHAGKKSSSRPTFIATAEKSTGCIAGPGPSITTSVLHPAAGP
eukprot:CAMPEP_0204426384 /NCGR_PEP_ID=MMETSP0470-20130426/52067_1 /ASSEMBLY_ACC=CAM_ASM_000385 /TAXON_ID=2969 /ORGANISM="Oxyrrhis marina" /LENGTH=87 /DNA_ID=CAMNT_0051424081 /DNA_START=74 /DNA_END=337 /DNA_ORIENTATION=+